MTVLCLDISSGGISAVLFNHELSALRRADNQWQFLPDQSGAATLSIETIVQRFKSSILDLSIFELKF
jgi:sugar (pentulose or hexulose) kinase